MEKEHNKIFVTQPDLPDTEELKNYIDKIFQTGFVTNCGETHNQLEARIEQELSTKNIALVSNGTIALMLAISALGLKNIEIITTPFSFVASAHSILWTGNIPKFVDIGPGNVNLNPKQIEKAITSKTKAILAVHCYGIPCDVDGIAEIAQKNNLKVIYDASHAFGVEINGRSLLKFGDVSTVSFHATKSFNTIEGGAVISACGETSEKVKKLRNFGFDGTGGADCVGLNGKLNEINSAIGLLNLNNHSENRKKRETIHNIYEKKLRANRHIKVIKVNEPHHPNYSYFPIKIESNSVSREDLINGLEEIGVIPRKYFFPVLTDLEPYRKYASETEFPNAKSFAENVLCLPIYPKLNLEDVDRICTAIYKITG